MMAVVVKSKKMTRFDENDEIWRREENDDEGEEVEFI